LNVVQKLLKVCPWRREYTLAPRVIKVFPHPFNKSPIVGNARFFLTFKMP
jgi:hypothetical protein